MRQWLVDTNVLLDVIGADPEFGDRSRQVLEGCAAVGALVVNPVILAEVSVKLDSLEEMDELLPRSLLRRDPLPWEAAFLAAKAFGRYKRRRGKKTWMLADFLIGAHAAVEGFSLLTRDAGYAEYFMVDVLNPAG